MYLRSALRSTPIGYVQMSTLLGLTAAVRPKTPSVYTIYSVNQITGELEEKDSRPISTKQYKPQGRHGRGAADLSTNSNTPGERNGIRTGISTSMQHNFSGEQGRDSTTLSNHRTPSGQHGSGTAGFSTNSGTPGFSTNSTQGGRNGIRTGISTIHQRSVLPITGFTRIMGGQGRDSTTLSNHRTPSGQHGSGTAGFSTNSEKPGVSTNSNTPEGRHRSGPGLLTYTPDRWPLLSNSQDSMVLSDILATELALPTTTWRRLGRRTATRTALRRRLGRRTGVWPTRLTHPYCYPYLSAPLVCNETRGLIRGQLVTP